MALSDAELLRRVQNREAEAFDLFSRRHARTLRLHLLRYVGPDDSEDLRQEVLLRLWDRAGQWEGRGSPLGWLLRIATNLALNHLRGQRVRPLPASGTEETGEPLEPSEAPGPGREEFEHREQAVRLLGLLAELPEEKRTVVRLARLEGAKLQEIAGQLGVPLGTVKSRLHAATQWLAARWEEEE